MTRQRRAKTTLLGALALALLYAAVASVNSHAKTTPSAPPPVHPCLDPCPKPTVAPTIRLIHNGCEHNQATRCGAPVDV